MLAGPAAGATAIFPGLGADSATVETDASFARLHGLYWLTANLTAAGPVVLLIDDLQWADSASLRWLRYVMPRLDELALVVVAALRPDDPACDATALAALAADPLTIRIEPRALHAAAVAEVLSDLTGERPNADVVAACHEATGGNPLLVSEVAAALVADDADRKLNTLPDFAAAGGRALARSVELRLASLSQDAQSLVRSCAVLGDGVPITHAAALADLEPVDAARARALLERAGILRVDESLGFVHPVVHEAVLTGIPVADRERAHQRAARLLHDAGAEPERVSAHLLASGTDEDAWAAEVLADAARGANVQGATESAIAYLRRALAIAPAERRLPVLLELGAAEALANGPRAAERLREAHGLLADPVERAECAAHLARVLLFISETREGVTLLRREIDGLGNAAAPLRRRLQAHLANGALFEPSLQDDADAALAGALEDDAVDLGGNMRRALWACRAAWSLSLPAEGAVTQARTALADNTLLTQDNGGGPFVLACWVLEAADQFDEALGQFESSLAEAQRSGSAFAFAAAKVFRAGNLLARGSLQDAEREAREAIAAFDVWGIELRAYPEAILGMSLLQRGETEAAAEVVDAHSTTDIPDNGHALRVLDVRAHVHVAAGDHARALTEFLQVGERFGALGGTNPALFPWRSEAAFAALRLGRQDYALELAAEELELARRWGAPRPIARALVALGQLRGGGQGIPMLEEAFDVIRDSPAKLDEARAALALGAALRRANQRAAAREPLGRAAELAHLCGAIPIVESAQTELRATGARPRRLMLSGVDSLTPSEARVARMAAGGATNREIAQALFVTPKTVEVHLSGAYRKLGIGSRTDLPALLSEQAA
ncbi:MAG: hypothetical protein QOJ29_697 [Thermoleophilaceae bacterium]|nr:hypothetical protein [Thermoleophilaceae bacterium]